MFVDKYKTRSTILLTPYNTVNEAENKIND